MHVPFTTSHINPGNKDGVSREECRRGECGKEGGLVERENERERESRREVNKHNSPLDSLPLLGSEQKYGFNLLKEAQKKQLHKYSHTKN